MHEHAKHCLLHGSVVEDCSPFKGLVNAHIPTAKAVHFLSLLLESQPYATAAGAQSMLLRLPHYHYLLPHQVTG